jgi:transposase InsO family protein
MDFMGPTPVGAGEAHLLSILDDHSRYGLWLEACANQQQETVKAALTACFKCHGLPRRLLTDNGPPWSTSGKGGITTLEAWLIRLGILVWHGAFYHPQTQGKVERWHRTIQAEVFAPTRPPYPSLETAQAAIDQFRQDYNELRPHAALDHACPASRYAPSPRPFPERLPELTYGPDDQVRKVRGQGAISFAGRSWFISSGLVGEPVGVRPTRVDGVFDVRYGHLVLRTLDLTEPG